MEDGGWTGRQELMPRSKTTANDLAGLLIKDVPGNWLDPILTGAHAVIDHRKLMFTCRDIERILNAIRQRMRKTIAAQNAPLSKADARFIGQVRALFEDNGEAIKSRLAASVRGGAVWLGYGRDGELTFSGSGNQKRRKR